MTIDQDLILRLENLARLQLSEEERQQIMGDLNNILQMVEQLQEIDTSNVEPLVYLTDRVNVMRSDEVKHQLNRKDALKNAPDANEEYFKVPKVIDI